MKAEKLLHFQSEKSRRGAEARADGVDLQRRSLSSGA